MARKQSPWEPRFPEIVDRNNDLLVEELDRSSTRHTWGPRSNALETDDVPWDSAPPASHVLEFRLIDARNFSPTTVLTELQGCSYIDVRFKPSGKRGTTQYQYRFTDHDRASRIYEKFVNADHPGEVVLTDLIAGGVPYVKIAEG